MPCSSASTEPGRVVAALPVPNRGQQHTDPGGQPSSRSDTDFDIIVVAGQSNAGQGGMGAFTDTMENPAADERIFQFDEARVPQLAAATRLQQGVATDALRHFGREAKENSMGLAIPFARRYAAENLTSGRAILIVPCAYGGTSILKWLGEIYTPATYPSGLYKALVARVRSALELGSNNRIVAFLWHQGEADLVFSIRGHHLMDDAMYEAKLTNFFYRFRKEFPSDPPFPIIAGELAPELFANDHDRLSIKHRFNSAIHTALLGDVSGGVASSQGLLSNFPSYTSDPGEAVHFASSALVTFGERYYDSWKQLGNIPAPECTLSVFPPHIAQGQSAILSWTTENARRLHVNNTVRGTPRRLTSLIPVSAGSKIMHPKTSTTYSAWAIGPGGTAKFDVRVSVTPPTIGKRLLRRARRLWRAVRKPAKA